MISHEAMKELANSHGVALFPTYMDSFSEEQTGWLLVRPTWYDEEKTELIKGNTVYGMEEQDKMLNDINNTSFDQMEYKVDYVEKCMKD